MRPLAICSTHPIDGKKSVSEKREDLGSEEGFMAFSRLVSRRTIYSH